MIQAVSPPGRLPDFVIIGAMKAGSTSLFRWLGQHPDVTVPPMKEPNFFCDDRRWSNGPTWYSSLFAEAASERRTGEASVRCTDPAVSRIAAGRMAKVVPSVRLVFLARNPIERARSHYAHQVQRGRERRPFGEAVLDPGSPYLAQSHYFRCLSPFIDRFPTEQLLVVRLEDLTSDDESAWVRVLDHLAIRPVGRPSHSYNVGEGKDRFSTPMRLAWEHGWLPESRSLPQPLRRLGRRLLFRRGGEDLRATAGQPVAEQAQESIWEDARHLARWLGAPNALWPEGDPRRCTRSDDR